jgi:hypothetical protein
LTLRKGKSRLLTVAWPDGKTPGPIEASGIKNQIENPMSKLLQPQFSVENLYPGEKRHVVARDTAEKLTGLAIVSEVDDGPSTLKLVRWATVRGRLVDDNDQPRSQGLRVRLEDYQLPIHTVNGTNYDKEDFAIDADGRFELIGLVPGAKYRLQLIEGGIFIRGNLTSDIVFEVGEDRDLGNVKVTK